MPRCQPRMLSRIIPSLVLVLIGCVTGAPERQATSPTRANGGPAGPGDRIPPLFRRAPWSTTMDEENLAIHTHAAARLRFFARSGELDRVGIRIYDENTNDVSFHYQGAFTRSGPHCLYKLSVYVYPAYEPLDQQLAHVQAEIAKANPQARAIQRVIDLDSEHGGTGVHAGYLNDIAGREAFDGVSVYARANWFIKYRTTLVPAGDPACEQRLRTAVTGMQRRDD